MNALCSGGISVSTTRVSTLSASRRVSKRSCNERLVGPYNRLMWHLPNCKERVAPSRITQAVGNRFVVVRFTPESGQIPAGAGLSALCQKQTFALQQRATLFNYLICAGQRQ